jgi:hypothetical protein
MIWIYLCEEDVPSNVNSQSVKEDEDIAVLC